MVFSREVHLETTNEFKKALLDYLKIYELNHIF
jgi:hypothetical protein